tara:strand:- start:511 stop:702 length:192 start_codon:yes stop_codon:yes gene_type:complete
MKKTYNTKPGTGLKGIYKHKATGKFEVKVTVKSNTKDTTFYVGLYPTIPAAVVGRQNFITNLF